MKKTKNKEYFKQIFYNVLIPLFLWILGITICYIAFTIDDNLYNRNSKKSAINSDDSKSNNGFKIITPVSNDGGPKEYINPISFINLMDEDFAEIEDIHITKDKPFIEFTNYYTKKIWIGLCDI